VLSQILTRFPMIGPITFLSAVERFSSTMYILLESGVPIIYALDIVERSIGNPILERLFSSIKEEIKRGQLLSTELGKSGLFPPLVVEITRIGEEAGNLPELFKKISGHYRSELGAKVERLISAFEPILIMFMGVVVGGLVVSMYLPIFKMAGAVGG